MKFSGIPTATVILNTEIDHTGQILHSPPFPLNGLVLTADYAHGYQPQQARGLLRNSHLIFLSPGLALWKQCDLNRVPKILYGLFSFISMSKMKGLAQKRELMNIL